MQLATAGAPPAFEEAHTRLERELELEHAMQQGRGKKKKNRRLSQVVASPSARLEPSFVGVVSEIAPLRSTVDQLLHEVRQLAAEMARRSGWSGSQPIADEQQCTVKHELPRRVDSRPASGEDTSFQILRALQASLDRESKQEELMLRLAHSNDQLSKKVDALSQQLAQHNTALQMTRAATPLAQADLTAHRQNWDKAGWAQCCAPTAGSGPAVLTLEADDSAAKWSLVT